MDNPLYDPTYLRKALIGGLDASNSVPYVGLRQRVTARIKAIYRVPVPPGYAHNTRARGDQRDDLRTRGTDDEQANPLELRDFLYAWIPLDMLERNRVSGRLPVTVGAKVDRDELMRLHLMACKEALRKLQTDREADYISDDVAEDVLSLMACYRAWLGRTCDHRRVDVVGALSECRDCGFTAELEAATA